MDLIAQDTAVVTNEKIVEIAFGIVLDRIKRNAPKEDLKLRNTKGFSVSRNLSSRCVRTFSYQCNDTTTTSSEESNQEHSCAHKSELTKLELWPVERAASTAIQLKNASTSMTPPSLSQSNGDCGRYYMLTDTRSKDTVLACHNSSASSDVAGKVAVHGGDKHLQCGLQLRCDSHTSGNGSHNSKVASVAEDCNFRMKIDQQQLSRVLDSTVDFPSELLVDVNCSNSCRVSEVSLKQGQCKQCVLAFRVDSSGPASAPAQVAVSSAANDDHLAGDCEDSATVKNSVEAEPFP